MLIVNADHLSRAGVGSLNELYPYCRRMLGSYPLIMSNDPVQTVYHIFHLATVRPAPG